MKDVIDLARDIYKLCHIVLDDSELRVIREMAQVDGGTCDQVVDHQNFPAAGEEVVA